MSEFQPKPFGRYFLVDKLATGGMAEIYKAKTFGVDGFEKHLAIKRILPHCSVDKEFISMLVDEAKLSVLLSHTNIVQVYDLGKVGEDYFISMEFIDGVNLRQVLNKLREKDQKLAEELAVYIISEMCKGLDYAHSKTDTDGKPLKIVHRDISPQNILVSYEGEVKIVDFGIAKAAMNISQTMAGILKGKISYMSPEQALGKKIDHQTDVYSSGLLFYEILTGEKFFTGETQFEVLKKIRTTRLNENSFPENINPELRKILAKALAYYTRDRYQTAGDMQIDLTRYLYTTYSDFTPRKLSKLIKKLFEDELAERKARAENQIDPNTKSILLAANQEDLVQSDKDPTVVQNEVDLKANTNTFRAQGLDGGHTQPSITSTSAGQIPYGADHTGSGTFQGAQQKGFPFFQILFLLFFIGAGIIGYLQRNIILQWINPKPIANGTIILESSPAGAEVFLDGASTGLITPARLEKLELHKPYKITIKKKLYKPWSRVLNLTNETAVTLNPSLTVIPVGSISVNTEPKGAKIFLNGEDTQLISPNSLKDIPLNETYTLKLVLDEYKTVEEKITIYSIEPVNFKKTLEKIRYGNISVSSNPSQARVYINGKDTGRSTPTTISKLEADQSYTIRIAKTGYHDVVRVVSVSPERTSAIAGKLNKKEENTENNQVTEKQKLEQELEKQRLEKQRIEKARLEKIKQQQQKNNVENNTNKNNTPDKNTVSKDGATYVAVNSSPRGASVFINGVQVGSTPGKFKVKPGSVNVTVSKDGARQSRVVTLRPGETRSLGTLSLKSGASGTLRISSIPTGAMVTINGAKQKATPLLAKGLQAGRTYSISVSLKGYETWSTSFTMDDSGKSFLAKLKKKD